MPNLLRVLLRVLRCGPHRHVAERAAAALLIVGRAAENSPNVPLAFNQIPSKSFQLSDDSLDFLRRVLLSWHQIYFTPPFKLSTDKL